MKKAPREIPGRPRLYTVIPHSIGTDDGASETGNGLILGSFDGSCSNGNRAVVARQSIHHHLDEQPMAEAIECDQLASLPGGSSYCHPDRQGEVFSATIRSSDAHRRQVGTARYGLFWVSHFPGGNPTPNRATCQLVVLTS